MLLCSSWPLNLHDAGDSSSGSSPLTHTAAVLHEWPVSTFGFPVKTAILDLGPVHSLGYPSSYMRVHGHAALLTQHSQAESQKKEEKAFTS
jgi:hypothetical protein